MGEVWGAMRAMCASRAGMLTGTPNADPNPIPPTTPPQTLRLART